MQTPNQEMDILKSVQQVTSDKWQWTILNVKHTSLLVHW